LASHPPQSNESHLHKGETNTCHLGAADTVAM